jgi:hypothetical protein
MNRFRNFITNQEGQHVSIMMIDGRIVEGKAILVPCFDSSEPFIEESDGVWVQPLDDSKMVLVWPKYNRKWVDAIEYGDNAFYDLDGSRQMAFINSCE